MNERVLLQPPDIIEVDGPVIFLGGPIQGAPLWQPEATTKIHDLDPEIIVASPRRDYPEGTFVYDNQVDWETHFLRRAASRGAIAFWLPKQIIETPGRAYAQTTGKELFEWKTKHEYGLGKIAVGIEAGFGNERYIRRRFDQDCPDVKIVDNLDDLCEAVVNLAREQGRLSSINL